MKSQFVAPDPPSQKPEEEDRAYQVDLDEMERYSELDPRMAAIFDISEAFLELCKGAQSGLQVGVSVALDHTLTGLELRIKVHVPIKTGNDRLR